MARITQFSATFGQSIIHTVRDFWFQEADPSSRGGVVPRARRVESCAIDVDGPFAAGRSMPQRPIRAEVVIREDPKRKHVAGVEGQPEHTPTLDVLVAGPLGSSTVRGKVRQFACQVERNCVVGERFSGVAWCQLVGHAHDGRPLR